MFQRNSSRSRKEYTPPPVSLMMTDPLTWSPINLGRWGGAQVRVHITLILFLATSLLHAVLSRSVGMLETVAWLTLLLVALALHEAGHALVSWWMGAEPEDIHLWPLGNMVGPIQSARAGDSAPLVAIGGLAFSLTAALTVAVALELMGARMVWNPFGYSPSGGTPFLRVAERPVTTFTTNWWIGWFGYLNFVIFLANLIPALPFDGGRIVRAYFSHTSLSVARDNLLPPILARGCVILLVLIALVRLLLSHDLNGLTLIGLAIPIEWIARIEAHMLEEGGFFEDGVFGYDFSEGYTSLEGSTAKVRPYRESALKRWRRRRSDLRRERRRAKEAAEERRMDEILDKIHREGRSALSEEETHFLERVSAKYRNRNRAHD
jgi:stage IV sporulation protein FB